MALVNITRKPVSLQGYQLTSPTDMLAALSYLSSRGYSGGVNCFKQAGNTVWQMSLVGDVAGLGAQMGNVGDWIVIENDTVASIISATKAAQIYQLT